MKELEIRTVDVVRYVTPLREGGSLPAIVEADDDFPYVIKFRGAGQGKNALIAELIGGELARGMGLKVPEIVFMNLDDSFGRLEPDEEIQDLLKFSVGLNLGLHYLAGAITYDPTVSVADELTASLVVLLDMMITNVDRTYRNTNLLNWRRELWLIDHGASLYFHHSWQGWEEKASKGFALIKDHVLLQRAGKLNEAVELIQTKVDADMLSAIVESIPEDFLLNENQQLSPVEKRVAYLRFLEIRLANIELLAKEANDARKASI